MAEEENIVSWDAIAESYQKDHIISVDDVHYAPLCAGEKELQLLGDVEGKAILEIGCGGGQNAVCLSRWNGRVTAVDPSMAHLKYAKDLDQTYETGVDFVRGRAEQLSVFKQNRFDIVLSSLVFDFIADIDDVFWHVFRVLRSEGLFVFSVIHPVMNAVGWHLMGDPDAFDVGNYFEQKEEFDTLWDFQDGTRRNLRHYNHTVENLFNALVEQGFHVTAIHEPRPYDITLLGKSDLEQIPYRYKQLDTRSLFFQTLQKLPYSLIFQAIKPRRELKE